MVDIHTSHLHAATVFLWNFRPIVDLNDFFNAILVKMPFVCRFDRLKTPITTKVIVIYSSGKKIKTNRKEIVRIQLQMIICRNVGSEWY